MNSKIRQLGKDTVIYGVGGALAKGIGFFLIPVYTRLFSQDGYGLIDMLNVANNLLCVIVAAGTDAALSFYFFQQKKCGPEAQGRVVSAVLYWRLIYGGIIVIAAVLFTPLLNTLFFKAQLVNRHLVYTFVTVLFVQVTGFGALVYRLFYRPWLYILLTVGTIFVSAAVTITLVTVYGMGIGGYVLGLLAGNAVIALVSGLTLRKHLRFDRAVFAWWPKIARYGIPLIPMGISVWVINMVNRWFLLHYHDLGTVALYSVGAQVSTIITLCTMTFRTAFLPIAFDSLHDDDGAQFFRLISRGYMGAGLALALLLALASPLIISLLAPAGYQPAYRIIGVQVLAAVYFGFLPISQLGILKSERTYLVTAVAVFSAGLNVLLNWLWVPAHGIMGAACALGTAMGVRNAVSLAVSEKLWRVGHGIRIMTVQNILAIGSVAGLVIFGYRVPAVMAAAGAVLLLIASSVPGRIYKRWLPGVRA